MGLNGSGKSTLPKMINGVMRPDKGRILARGRIAGLIFSQAEEGAGTATIRLGRELEAEGVLYSQGNLILNSPFLGQVQTRTLTCTQGAQPFDNWFKDVDIRVDSRRRPVLPLGFSNRIEVLEWLRR